METKNETTYSCFVHLSSFASLFFPLGNFIAPTIMWALKKEDSKYIDYHGKQVINFQLSMLLYFIVFTGILVLIALMYFPTLIHFGNIFNQEVSIKNFDFGANQSALISFFTTLFFIFLLKVSEIALTINAAIKASKGINYQYPLAIPFIK